MQAVGGLSISEVIQWGKTVTLYAVTLFNVNGNIVKESGELKKFLRT